MLTSAHSDAELFLFIRSTAFPHGRRQNPMVAHNWFGQESRPFLGFGTHIEIHWRFVNGKYSCSWLCSTIVYHIVHSAPLIHVMQATQFYYKCLMDMFSMFLVHTHFLLVFAFFLPGLPTSDPPAPLDPPLPSESRSCLSWLRCLRFPKKKHAYRTAFN